MKAVFEKSRLSGIVKAPPSKSAAHRLIISAALAGGVSEIRGVEYSEDILATLDCAEALGAKIVRGDDFVVIDGREFLSVDAGADGKLVLNCRESGSTLRFFIPLAMLTGVCVEFLGSERLMARPLGVYEKLARENSIEFDKKDGCITILGKLPNKELQVDGGVSSQFITGLMFALVRLGGGSAIHVIPPFESRPYVEMTVGTLRQFGARIEFSGNDIIIDEGQSLHTWSGDVEGDFSNAAFLDAYNLIGGDVTVTGLPANSAQGDAAYRAFFHRLKNGTPTIDLSDTPDLAPILIALAACLHGATFTGTHRLAAKESDRGAVMAEELRKFGVQITVGEDTITVPRCGVLHAPTSPIAKHNDHRIVMALSTLLTLTGGEIHGCEDVKKSFPSYFDTIKKLGARFTLMPDERTETI